MVATTLAAAGSLTIAGLLNRENRALLGWRSIVLSTDPPDAQVAFIPLSKSTGEPSVKDAVFASGEPVKSAELLPGDYLVVAVTHEGRFHEVFRHVPDRSELMPWSLRHRRWRQMPDGVIDLPRVKIPSQSVIQGMALIEGSDAFRMGVPNSTVVPVHRRRVASFYIDPTEFTFADYKKLYRQLPHRYRQGLKSEQLAMPMDYQRAVALAEELGKRLPTEIEYEFAATVRGQCTYPWGNSEPQTAMEAEIGPVTASDFDMVDTDPPVFGLCSNVAEWTSTWAIPYPPHLPAAGFENLKQSRIVRGGVLPLLSATSAPALRWADPRQRVCVPCNHSEPRLGFRCARSARPLIPFAEFP
jgi:formylglycine-generating enzyme required for sulfatase activity